LAYERPVSNLVPLGGGEGTTVSGGEVGGYGHGVGWYRKKNEGHDQRISREFLTETTSQIDMEQCAPARRKGERGVNHPLRGHGGGESATLRKTEERDCKTL